MSSKLQNLTARKKNSCVSFIYICIYNLEPRRVGHTVRLLTPPPEPTWEVQGNAEQCHQHSCSETTKLTYTEAPGFRKKNVLLYSHS